MPRPGHILALDQGTTSTRTVVFDRSGAVISMAQMALRQIYPQPGWVEHDPYELWSSQNATLSEALSRANLSAVDVAALGITNQRETTVVWDSETGVPVCNAIVWQDRRTTAYCAELRKDGVEPLVSERTGLRIDPYFSATKIRWILDHIPGARRRAEDGRLRCGTVDTWLIWQLTRGRVHATDPSNASRTLLCNLRTGDWDETLLELFGIPRPMLPRIHDSSGILGAVDRDLHPAGAPIAGVAGDQQAALFGQACFSPGRAKNTYGTGCFMLMNTGPDPVPSRNNLLTTIAWRIGGRTEYALEGSVFIGGAVIQWLRDELRIVRDAQEFDDLAASVPDAGGLFLVPAFAGLGAPHWDPNARGALLGITRGTGRAQVCRAAMEAIAFQCADLIGCMERDSGLPLSELRVDGGASRSGPLLQFQADLLGVPVIRPTDIETTARGAAFLAGLAVGAWDSREAILQSWRADRTFSPSLPPAATAARRAGWNRALERSKGWEDPG